MSLNNLTKGQKLIKERYFKRVSKDPLHYAPISDESIRLSPLTFTKLLDMIINILEKEYECDVLWKLS